jgi:hypothetical protein
MNEILQISSISIFEQTAAREIFAIQTREIPPPVTRHDIQKTFEFNQI